MFSFTVTAATPVGPLSVRRDTALSAIEKALELLGEGVTEVFVTGPDGTRYVPSEFDTLLAKENDNAQGS
jgi:hypothetical protein